MNLLDFILNLFRSPDAAQAFVADPEDAMRVAGVPPTSAAQFQAVAATAAPAGAVMGGGDPVVGLQRAVADHHSIPASIGSPFSPQTAFAPETHAAFASGNNTPLLSGNEIASPNAGESVQQGGVNLDFSDMTFGDRNTASDGSVINTGTAGDIDATNVKGDGNVVGDGNTANTGSIKDSNVNLGDNGKIDDRGDITAGGDVIKDNEGPVVNDVDMSGGGGGNASAGGGVIGGGEANAGGGGAGGGLVINDNDSEVVGGNKTTTEVGGDVSGSGGIKTDNSVDNSVDNSGQDNSVNKDQSVDNSVDQSTHVETDISNEVDANVGGGGGGGFDPIGTAGDVAGGVADVADDIFG
jgi:hypothetical protein